jgi:hypothetical protein
MKGENGTSKIISVAILALLFSTAAVLTPLATSYAYTHTVLGESAAATW